MTSGETTASLLVRASQYDTEIENVQTRRRLSVLISDVQFSFQMSTGCPLVDTKMRITAWSPR